MPTTDHSVLEQIPSHSPYTPAALPLAPPGRQQGIGKEMCLYLALVGVALVLLYASVFRGLWDLWMTREDYSHGFLVPLISLYLAKTRCEDIRHLPIRPGLALGAGLVLLSLAGLFVGVAGGVITLSSVSFIGMLAGLTVLLFGYPYLRLLALPFAYLIFMTPVLDVIVEPLHDPLQLLAAKVVSALFQLAGVPVYRDGTFIQFSNGVLEVAVQCSGAGYLIAVLAIGLPLAALALRTWRNRIMLIVIALFVSVLTNWARVMLIGAIGYFSGWGPQVHGPLHILQGMLVYWIGFAALFACAWMLVRMERGRMMAGRSAMGTPSHIGFPWDRMCRVWGVALAILATAVVYLYGYDKGPVAASHSLASLPQAIGSWLAVETETAQAAPLVKIAGADQELSRVYRKADGSTVRLYVAYLDYQTQGRELVNYLTAPLHQEAKEAPLRIGQETIPVNRGFVTDHASKTPIVFWYALNGRSIADRYQAKAATIVHALAHQGSNGALVLISGQFRGDGGDAAADEMNAFARELFPILHPYLP
jgi:EpsI family protein